MHLGVEGIGPKEHHRQVLGEPGGLVGRAPVLVTATLAFGGELLGIGGHQTTAARAPPDKARAMPRRRAESRDSMAQLGRLPAQDVDLGGRVQVAQLLDDLDAMSRKDRGRLIAPALKEVGRLCGVPGYAELWPAQAWYLGRTRSELRITDDLLKGGHHEQDRGQKGSVVSRFLERCSRPCDRESLRGAAAGAPGVRRLVDGGAGHWPPNHPAAGGLRRCFPHYGDGWGDVALASSARIADR